MKNIHLKIIMIIKFQNQSNLIINFIKLDNKY